MDERNDPLAVAVRKWADEARGQAGEHPAAERLAAYAGEELEAAAAERLRDHLALCRECSRLVLELRAFSTSAPAPDAPELAPAEVEREWERLRRRVGGGGGRPAARPRAAAPWLPWAVAASLLVATLGVTTWGASLQRRLREQALPRGDAELLDDFPTSGSREPERTVRRGAPLLVVVDPPVPRGVALFKWEIVSARDARVPLWQGPAQRSRDGRFALQLPADFLAAGHYTLWLSGAGPRGRIELAEVALRVRL
ncbi:MAG TPA: hypothetical protein VF121_12970 [Thermoanaerobaculia bacterium]|nr:hypothetical protein [Thermoanaerobaculia bacterium]